MTVKAIFENAMFKPRELIHVEEQTEVELVIAATAPSDGDDPAGWKTTEAPIGFIDEAPADTPNIITTNTWVRGGESHCVCRDQRHQLSHCQAEPRHYHRGINN
jgi:hypothetical protein